MKSFFEMAELINKKAAGFLVEGKVFCPYCAGIPPKGTPLSPKQVEEGLKGSRPEADRLVSNPVSGPSYKCHGGCGERFIDKAWRESLYSPAEEIDFGIGTCCQHCYAQLKVDQPEMQYPGAEFFVAKRGDTCDYCNKTSTGWEWVNIGRGKNPLEVLDSLDF